MDIKSLVEHCRDAYRNCYMPWTSGATWPQTKNGIFYMDMHYLRNDGTVSGFPNARIKCQVAPKPLEHTWATNTLFRDTVPRPIPEPITKLPEFGQAFNVSEIKTIRDIHQYRFRATIIVNPELTQKDQVFRKEVFAREFLEVAMGIADFDTRKVRRGVNENRDEIDRQVTEEARAIWDDSDDERELLEVGLRELLLSYGSIDKHLKKNGIDWGLLTANSTQTAKDIASRYHLREDLAVERLSECLSDYQR